MNAPNEPPEGNVLGGMLTPGLDEAQLADVWRRVGEARHKKSSGGRRLWLLVPVALAAGALGLWIGLGHRNAGPLSAARGALGPGTHLADTLAVDSHVQLGDGSDIGLGAAAELEVIANDGEHFITALRHGRVHFDVQPGGPRRWTIETDLATVEVVGTAFVVDRQSSGLVVAVERGVVLVRGERVPGRVARLTAGERLEIPAEVAISTHVVPAPEPTQAPVPEPAVAPPAAVVAPAPVQTPTVVPQRRTPAPPPVVEAPRPVEDPITAGLARADALRAGGDLAGAAEVLAEVVENNRTHPSVGLAAFTWGRLEQELGRPERAARAFGVVVQLGQPASLVADALARRALSLAAAGDHAEARRLAADYLARYPRGPHAHELEPLVTP